MSMVLHQKVACLRLLFLGNIRLLDYFLSYYIYTHCYSVFIIRRKMKMKLK